MSGCSALDGFIAWEDVSSSMKGSFSGKLNGFEDQKKLVVRKTSARAVLPFRS